MSFFYSEEDINIKIEQIQNYCKIITNPVNVSAFEITHFLRGELFVLMDCLLTTNFMLKYMQGVETPKAELKHILEVCDSYCLLYATWLSVLPNLFDAVISQCYY